MILLRLAYYLALRDNVSLSACQCDTCGCIYPGPQVKHMDAHCKKNLQLRTQAISHTDLRNEFWHLGYISQVQNNSFVHLHLPRTLRGGKSSYAWWSSQHSLHVLQDLPLQRWCTIDRRLQNVPRCSKHVIWASNRCSPSLHSFANPIDLTT